jgi:hypothetical protein
LPMKVLHSVWALKLKKPARKGKTSHAAWNVKA